MSRLYLVCAVCSRRQADGLISGAAWGKMELPPGVELEHPALKGSHLRCCPSCVQRHPEWAEELMSSLGLAGDEPPQAAVGQ
ncbi:MAG TPA: hypothetical protein VMK83_00130 [Gaiellaceae bacterium]|nr:hypothetical protein [Gaiellaceae bacterium]